MLGVELIAELVEQGRIELSNAVERTVTYHDPCRLNKRKGVHKAPRDLLRAIPGLTFKDVDHVTQWSYCSGGGGGLPIEKPEITRRSAGAGSRARGARGRRPGQRVPVVRASALRGGRAPLEVLDLFEIARRVGGHRGGRHARGPEVPA